MIDYGDGDEDYDDDSLNQYLQLTGNQDIEGILASLQGAMKDRDPNMYDEEVMAKQVQQFLYRAQHYNN